ncbi:MAG: tRNA (adenine(22)-N(1))-methyltransferase TrmK [Firmicutes bacterium]|nr:tRNA (adenine(22)-N(1))-methyltransferase TrmK [Bacillota bacterium]
MARSKRIEYLANLTKGFDRVLDIGTDHGFVLAHAFEHNLIKSAIASDLREKPLNQAKTNLKGYPVEYIIANGFKGIQRDFDLAIIAGMGAYLITEIMNDAPQGNQTYLLQANDKIEILREYLINHEFKIVDEYVVLDKFFYVILKVVRGKMNLLDEDIYLGPILKNKSEALPYYAKKAKQIEKILPHADEKRQEILKKMLKIYKNS